MLLRRGGTWLMNLDLHLFSTRGPLTFLRKPYDNPEHLSPLLRRRGLPVSLSCKTWAFPARSAAGFKACCSICIPGGNSARNTWLQRPEADFRTTLLRTSVSTVEQMKTTSQLPMLGFSRPAHSRLRQRVKFGDKIYGSTTSDSWCPWQLPQRLSPRQEVQGRHGVV